MQAASESDLFGNIVLMKETREVVYTAGPAPLDEEAQTFLGSVEEQFATRGVTIYKARNEVKVIGRFNVKRFGVPGALNRIVYGLFRKPKAVRACLNARTLMEKGVPTPEPFGYVLHRKGILLAESYLVTRQSGLGRNMYEFGHGIHPSDVSDVLAAFGRFSADIHEKGVLHLDYSPGNIIFDRTPDGAYLFSLVDVNRMRFLSRPVTIEEGCRNMCRLWGDEPVQRAIAAAYAEARGADPERVTRLLMQAHHRFWQKRDTRWIHTPWSGKEENDQ